MLFAPHKKATLRSPGCERIQRRLVRAFVEKFWERLFFRTTNRDRLAIDYLCHVRLRVVQVANQNRLCWAHDHTGGLKTDIDAVRAEVTFLGRVIFGVDEDRIVGTGRDASFATDADRFVEIDNTVLGLNMAVVVQAVTQGAWCALIARVSDARGVPGKMATSTCSQRTRN